MNPNLQFSFDVDKENNSLKIKREFNAPLDRVWEAWTTAEILDQWWAPKPYKAVTKSMDFREGGRWLYYMESPEGHKHWCKNDYEKIDPKKSFSGLDAFCDEEGEVNTAMPRTLWTNTFNQSEDKTLVTIIAKYENLEDLEKVLNMGMKEGFTMALQNLDEYLEQH